MRGKTQQKHRIDNLIYSKNITKMIVPVHYSLSNQVSYIKYQHSILKFHNPIFITTYVMSRVVTNIIVDLAINLYSYRASQSIFSLDTLYFIFVLDN